MKDSSHVLASRALRSIEPLKFLHCPPFICHKWSIHLLPLQCSRYLWKESTATTPNISDWAQHFSQGSRPSNWKKHLPSSTKCVLLFSITNTSQKAKTWQLCIKRIYSISNCICYSTIPAKNINSCIWSSINSVSAPSEKKCLVNNIWKRMWTKTPSDALKGTSLKKFLFNFLFFFIFFMNFASFLELRVESSLHLFL